jgi:predicted phage tail protein
VSASAGNASASVTWTAPSSNGGAAITGYVVQYSSDNGDSWTTASCSGTATTCNVTGPPVSLLNGTGYIFHVAATNAVGTGSYSTASSSVTPATLPGAPTAVSASAGNASASVTWTAPSSNGGAAITGYVVQYSSDNGNSWTTANCPPIGTTCNVTGLTPGVTYAFSVIATNRVGNSAPSTSTTVEAVLQTNIGFFGLKAQVVALLNVVEADHLNAIAVYGYANPGQGGMSTQLANDVKVYVVAKLKAMHITGVTVTVTGGASTTMFNHGKRGPANRCAVVTASRI